MKELYNPPQVYVTQTWDSKTKGDEGIYAALSAAGLARALRGATASRLALHQRLVGAAHSGQMVLGEQPAKFQHASAEEMGRGAMLEVMRDDKAVALFKDQPAVGIPDELMMEELKQLMPLITRVKPETSMSYDDLLCLFYLLNLNGASVTTLDVGGVVSPSAEQQPETSAASLQKKIEELRARYPLPAPKEKNPDEDSGDDNEDNSDAGDGAEQYKHNEGLRERCEKLQIPYTNYTSALMDVAKFEMRVFLLLCGYLSSDRSIKVVQMDHNDIGAESSKAEDSVDLVPLRALASMIDANETIKILDLSHNKLGSNGIGIIAKALTKNISLVVVDLSSNRMNADPLEELEDPEHEEEDPMFGETYAGLEALSEVLKRNKFMRALRLCDNGIHAGDEVTSAPPEEDMMEEFHPEEDAYDKDVSESWEDIPLWKFLRPLMNYHRLEMLDLTGNQLHVQGTRMLATALATNTSVRYLDLTDNAIGFRGLHYLAKLVIASPMSVLHTLVLRRNELAGKRTSKRQQKAALQAMGAFASALEGNRKVRRLSFSNNHLGASLSAALLRTIGTAEAVEELDFEFNDACGDHATSFDPSVAHLLAAALYPSTHRSKPTLRTLRFGGNNLREAGAAILFPPGFAPPHALMELDLSRNELGDQGLAPVSNILVGSTTLTRLGLAYNAIASAALLLPGLSENKTLMELDLSHNKLGDQEGLGCVVAEQVLGVDHLLSCLADRQSLQAIDLSWNDLKSVHAEHLTAIFAQPAAAPALKKLDVSSNPKIPQVQVTAMTSALASRPGMEVFFASVPSAELSVAQPAMLELLGGIVGGSETLLDISCGLRGSGNVNQEEHGGNTGDTVGAIRRRLLLNALVASHNEQ